MCAAAAAHSRWLRASIAGARVRRITTVTAEQRPDAVHYEPTPLTGKRAVGHSVNPRPTGLKGANIGVAGHALARWYSWIRPPRRSRRWLAPELDYSCSLSVLARRRSRARCGLSRLSWSTKTRTTCSRWRWLRISSQSRHAALPVRTNRSAIAFACGARTGVLTLRMPSLRKMSAKEPLYLLSRSRIKKRRPLSEKSGPRLRACWVTHSPVGLAVQPASQTRRFACAMSRQRAALPGQALRD